ncbi:MAG: hypothetical protein GWP23_09290 [Synechococcales cyanobacterium H12SWP_bin.12]|nr:hypothetical protein [Synechococcales cyanobacterium H12SWP_bin.12]
MSALITELLMKKGSEKALKGRIRRNETAKAKRDQKRAADVESITSWGLDPKRHDASLRWISMAKSLGFDLPEKPSEFWESFYRQYV